MLSQGDGEEVLQQVFGDALLVETAAVILLDDVDLWPKELATMLEAFLANRGPCSHRAPP